MEEGVGTRSLMTFRKERARKNRGGLRLEADAKRAQGGCMNRKSSKRLLARFVRSNGVPFLLSLVVIVGLIVWARSADDGHPGMLFDFTIFFSFVAGILIRALSDVISNVLSNFAEDDLKLDANYERLAKRYPPSETDSPRASENLFEIGNEEAEAKNLAILEKREKRPCGLVRLPTIVDCSFDDPDIALRIKDSQSFYEPPRFVSRHYAELLAAHATSDVYNQLNIRVASWSLRNGAFVMSTMRTTYFDSLATNRAMDLKLQKGFTLRDRYQYGPFAPSLTEDSPLSNHLGFNAFVISSDGRVPFVWRSGKNSVAKRTYGTSVSASLKAKYALDSDHRLTEETLRRAVLREMRDELKLDESDIEPQSLSEWVIAAYRDLVEGGKPQLLFVLRARKSSEEIEEAFLAALKKKRGKTKSWDLQARRLEDGNRLLWLCLNDLRECAVGAGTIACRQKTLRMTPSGTTSVALFREWIKGRDPANEEKLP